MSHRQTFDGRPEVPSRGELWSIVLGALLASALLTGAFRVAASAGAPLADDESAYRSAGPVLRAADRPEPPRAVTIEPERRVTVRHRRHRAPVAPVPSVADAEEAP